MLVEFFDYSGTLLLSYRDCVGSCTLSICERSMAVLLHATSICIILINIISEFGCANSVVSKQ